LDAPLRGHQVALTSGLLGVSPPVKPQQKKRGSAEMKKATPKSSQSHTTNSTASSHQRQRLLVALRKVGNDGLTTIQIREQLDIMMPAARVHELRWDYGYNIQAIPAHDRNAQANRHTCKRYVLFPGEWPKLRRAA
jgi:hypothetical protein